MKVEQKYIRNEDEGKITWAKNGAVSYAVVNKEKLNTYGEAPGYHIFPSTSITSRQLRVSLIKAVDSGSVAHLTVQSSTALGQAANWANHHLYALQHHDTEPKSAYAYNSYDPHNPAVDFNEFFDGESLEQEDIVLLVSTILSILLFLTRTCSYVNLGTHHIPNTADLPNTVTTTAVTSFGLAPQNYFAGDISRSTIHGVRLSFDETSSIVKTDTFGTEQPICLYDMNQAAPDLSSFIGEIAISKFPWNPSGSLQTNPGG